MAHTPDFKASAAASDPKAKLSAENRRMAAGSAMGEFEEAAEQEFLEFGEAFEIVETFHPADHGGESW